MSNTHAQWDSLLTDIERQLEQQRHIRPRRLVLQGIAVAIALFGIGGAAGMLTVRLLQAAACLTLGIGIGSAWAVATMALADLIG